MSFRVQVKVCFLPHDKYLSVPYSYSLSLSLTFSRPVEWSSDFGCNVMVEVVEERAHRGIDLVTRFTQLPQTTRISMMIFLDRRPATSQLHFTTNEFHDPIFLWNWLWCCLWSFSTTSCVHSRHWNLLTLSLSLSLEINSFRYLYSIAVNYFVYIYGLDNWLQKMSDDWLGQRWVGSFTSWQGVHFCPHISRRKRVDYFHVRTVA